MSFTLPPQQHIAHVIQPSLTVAEGIEQLRVICTSTITKQLKPHQLLIHINAACVNYPDLLMIANKYQHKPTFPFTPGMEWAGKVIQVGSSVKAYKPGDRVMGVGGGLAEYKQIHSSSVLSIIPDRLSYTQAASFWVGFTTAYHCLVERGHLKKGEWLLVNGGTGGMGMAAILLARHIGANVICTGGTDEKLLKVSEFANIPFSNCINYNKNEQFSKLVKSKTPNNRGVDIVFDPVGGNPGMECLRSTTWGARLLIVGFTSGVHQKYSANYILIKGLTVIGCRAGEYIRRVENGIEKVEIPRRNELLKLATNGLVPFISNTYPFTTTGVRNCFRDLFERRIVGRACVVMNHESKIDNRSISSKL